MQELRRPLTEEREPAGERQVPGAQLRGREPHHLLVQRAVVEVRDGGQLGPQFHQTPETRRSPRCTMGRAGSGTTPGPVRLRVRTLAAPPASVDGGGGHAVIDSGRGCSTRTMMPVRAAKVASGLSGAHGGALRTGPAGRPGHRRRRRCPGEAGVRGRRPRLG